MKKIELEPIYDKVMPLMPAGHTLALEQGKMLVTIESIEMSDRLKNCHIKTLRGTYDRATPSRIRIRDHYPHMAGDAWGIADVTMYGYYNSGKPLITSSEYSRGSCFKDPRGFYVHNMALDRETTFWAARDDDVIISGESQPYSMRYFTGDMEPGDIEDYYKDQIPEGAYPYGTSPSSWINATIDTENKTWEATITLNQFWVRDMSGENLNMQLNGYERDPRLHFIEIQIQVDGEESVDTGARVAYLWHLPISFANVPAPNVERVMGTFSGPSDIDSCYLGPGLSGCHYNVGYYASGGVIRMNFEEVALNYIEREFLAQQSFYLNYSRNPDRISTEFEVQNINQISSLYASVTYDEITYTYNYDLNTVSIEHGFLVCSEFANQRISGWEALPTDEYIAINIHVIVDVSEYIYGYSNICHTNQIPGTLVNKAWCTKHPGCSQYCIGGTAYTITLAKFYLEDDSGVETNWTIGPVSIYFDLDKQFGTSEDTEIAVRYGTAGKIQPYILASASDGGRTKYWIIMDFTTTPENDIDGAVNDLPKFGTSSVYHSTHNEVRAITYHSNINVFTFSKLYMVFEDEEVLIGPEEQTDWTNSMLVRRDA